MFEYRHNYVCHGPEDLSQDGNRPSSLFPSSDYTLSRPVGKYEVYNIISGSGTFGSIYLATYNSVQVAVKVTHKFRSPDRKSLSSKACEIELMKTINHRNVQGLLDMLEVTNSDEFTCQMSVLELVTGGDLYSYLDKYCSLSEREVQFFGWQLLKGLEYLHDRHIAHRGQWARSYWS